MTTKTKSFLISSSRHLIQWTLAIFFQIQNTQSSYFIISYHLFNQNFQMKTIKTLKKTGLYPILKKYLGTRYFNQRSTGVINCGPSYFGAFKNQPTRCQCRIRYD